MSRVQDQRIRQSVDGARSVTGETSLPMRRRYAVADAYLVRMIAVDSAGFAPLLSVIAMVAC
jgi:hypothetical protein